MNQFQSKFTMILKEEEKKEKNQREKLLQLKDELLSKRLSYSKLVKETFKPEVSEKKRVEMEFLKKSINGRGLPSLGGITPKMSRAGNRGSQSARLLENEGEDSPEGEESESESDRSIDSTRAVQKMKQSPEQEHKPKITWKFNNSMKPPTKQPRQNNATDWLQQRRKKRVEGLTDPEAAEEKISYRPHDWEKELIGMSEGQKATFLTAQAKAIEDQAEEIDKTYKLAPDRYAKSERTDEMLIDAINAKIAILDQI